MMTAKLAPYYIIDGNLFIEVPFLVQNRLLPLLFLLLSSQAYSEDIMIESEVTTPKDDMAITDQLSDSNQAEETATPNNSDSASTTDDASLTTSNKEPSSSSQSNASSTSQTSSPVASDEKDESHESERDKNQSVSINDDGVDEDLIAELLEEDAEPVKKSPKKAPLKKKAAPAAPASTWFPEIEFGYRSEQGNEDERSLNTRLALSYIKGRLRNTGEIKLYLKNEDGKEDEREQTYQLQSDYKISPKMYIYGSFKGIDSKYSSYFHDYTISTGLGYQITNTDSLKVETELGPGYRYQEPNTDEIDDDDPIFPENVDEPIIRANLTAQWQPFDSISFNFDGTVVSGSSNTRIDTEISILNHITEDISLKIAQSRQHLSRVPNNLSKTDSIFTINILYSPK